MIAGEQLYLFDFPVEVREEERTHYCQEMGRFLKGWVSECDYGCGKGFTRIPHVFDVKMRNTSRDILNFRLFNGRQI